MLSWENDLTQHEEKSVVATFTPALSKIQQTPDAVTFLRILCFCDPEGIPLSIFEQGRDALDLEDPYVSSSLRVVDELQVVRDFLHSSNWVPSAFLTSRHHTAEAQGGDQLEAVRDLFRSPLRLSKAIQEVQRLSLAAQALENTDRIIRIHDLIHLLLRSKLMTNTERRQWLEIAISMVWKAFRETCNPKLPETWSRCSRFLSHIESLEGFAEQYGLISGELLASSGFAALYLDECGLYEKAAMLYKRSLERSKTFLDSQDPSTFVTMENLARVLDHQGRYEEAEKMHRQTLALKESVVGKKHPFTLNSMTLLASVLDSQGKHEEAERMHRQRLILSESVLSKKHPDTLMCMDNLAIVLKSQGKYEEAEKVFRQTLALKESVLGKEHPDTLVSMSGLASVLESQDKYDEAERMRRQTLILRKSVLGKKHLDTLESMNSLAVVLGDQAKYTEAEEIFRQTLVLKEAVLGKEHPDTLQTVHQLAYLLHICKQYGDATPLYRRAVTGLKDMLGGEHPRTLHCLKHYYSMLREVRDG